MRRKIARWYKRTFWSNEKFARKSGVKIGKRCSIETRDFDSEPYLIEIGDNVQITKGVKFHTHGGGWMLRDKISNFDAFGRIKLGDNIYIGNDCHIMPGVTIDSNVIIGAGSIVTKSVPSGCIVAGNSARKIGTVSDFTERMIPHNFGTKQLHDKRSAILNTTESLFIEKPYMKE